MDVVTEAKFEVQRPKSHDTMLVSSIPWIKGRNIM